MENTMDIRIYIGAHRTAGRHIESILVKNEDLLKKQGILLVTHAMQLPAYRAAKIASEEGQADKDVAKLYLDMITKGADFKTLIIMDRVRCGSVTRPVGKSLIYPQIRVNLVRFAKLLPANSYRLFMGIRAPATFLPSCYSDSLSHAKLETFEKFLQGADLRNLRWSETLERIQRTFQNQDTSEKQIVTWRFEDYPRMWRDVVGALSGVDNPQDLVGDAIPVNEGLSLYGCQLMHKYLQDHDPKAPGDFKKIRDAFLEKFKNEDDLNPEPFAPPEFIEAMDYAYEDDWYYIERMENVAALTGRPIF
jgi:hypothetical protein